MILILRALTLDGRELTQPLLARFDAHGGTLGRGEAATFMLPDPMRMISRVQARVLHDAGAYRIENVGGSNPLLHNSRPLSAGMSVALAAGDEIRVGGYRLIVEFADDEATTTVMRAKADPHAEGPNADDATRIGTFGPRIPVAALATAGDVDTALRVAFAQFAPQRLAERLGDAAGDAATTWRRYCDDFPTVCAEARTAVEVALARRATVAGAVEAAAGAEPTLRLEHGGDA